MMMRNQTKNFRNYATQFFRQYCAVTVTPTFFWPARLRADGVAIHSAAVSSLITLFGTRKEND
jgi:hypothetical protein